MRILASALVDTVDQFLHAGYISAYPRSLYPDMMLYGEGPTLQLDMVQALQLQGETAAATLGGGGHLAAAASAGPELWAVASAAAVGAVGFALLQRKLGMGPRTALATGALAGVMVIGPLACGELGDPGAEEKALPAPWEGVELQAFADPQAATEAILYGIVADGLANIDFEADELKHIQLEVGLPTTDPSPGLAHALETYGFDGWRNELRLQRDDGSTVDGGAEVARYTVTSAGEDGAFDTEDDIVVRVEGSTDASWDQNRWATFLRPDDQGELVMLFHRWRGEHFEYLHQAAAADLTGSELFDVFQADDLEHWIDSLQAAYDDAAAEVDHDPILLQVYRTI
jgi:hypothetical protein